MMTRSTLMAVTAASLAASSFAAAPVEIEFAASAITTLSEIRPDNNFGQEIHFAVGTLQNPLGTLPYLYPRNRALLQFDIAGMVPAGATIQSAQLVVWVTLQPPADEGEPSMTFDVHRMLVPWVEGIGVAEGGPPVGAPALAGESTWNARLHGSTPWGTPGGLAGTDFATDVSASFYAGSPEVGQTDCNPCSTFPGAQLLAADVQFWLDNPSQNRGWLVKAQDEFPAWSTKQFMTPESGINDFPHLIISYTESVPEPSTVAFALLGGLALVPLLRRARRG